MQKTQSPSLIEKNGMQICGEGIEYLLMHMVLGKHRSMFFIWEWDKHILG
jgi:hypothetical protein